MENIRVNCVFVLFVASFALAAAMPASKPLELPAGQPMPVFDEKMFQILETKFTARVQQLLRQREDDKALQVLRHWLNIEKQWRAERCRVLLSDAICDNKSPQPFRLWAKVAARELTRDPSELMRQRVLSSLNLINK